LPPDEPIERYLPTAEEIAAFQPSDRYKITESGISPRWLPGQSDAVYAANSDEHTADGTLTEEAGPSEAMYAKRLRKLDTLLQELPEPVIHGPEQAALSFVGWGSVKNTVADVLRLWNEAHPDQKINYLHYEYVYPVKTEVFKILTQTAQKLVLIENNALGQLGALLTQHTGYLFTDKLLKFDGRGFFVEDILKYLEEELGALYE